MLALELIFQEFRGFKLLIMAFKFKFGAIGQTVEGIEELQQRLKILLFTQKQSLPGDPQFGTQIADFIPDPVGNRARIIAEVMQAISRYEVGLQVLAIEVSDLGEISIKIAGVGIVTIA